MMQYENSATFNSPISNRATLNNAILKWCNIKRKQHENSTTPNIAISNRATSNSAT